MENNNKLLLHGIDSLYCAYYLEHTGEASIDFQKLTQQKESLRQSKSKDPLAVKLGNSDFFLYPYGTASGYPLVLSNEYFKVELGQYNNPNFYVAFKSQALWRESAFLLHEKFLEWAGSVGYSPYKPESISRVDYCFDYNLPMIDFTEDSFVSRSNKDSKHREDGKTQTFTYGKGDIVLRVYDKVAEIKQQSEKVWFYLLWGQDKDVWRIEWQVRRPVLKLFDIKTFEELKAQLGDLLRYLAEEHDTLRIPNEDSNPSRWPLHPLWRDLQEKISQLDQMGICRVYGQAVALEERMTRMAIAIYGYLKRIAAVYCVQNKVGGIDADEALDHVAGLLRNVYEPLSWENDVQKRIKEIQLGEW